MRRRWLPLVTITLLLGMSLSMTACPAKGPAQRSGEKIDKALGTSK
jgi:hypothetical protein